MAEGKSVFLFYHQVLAIMWRKIADLQYGIPQQATAVVSSPQYGEQSQFESRLTVVWTPSRWTNAHARSRNTVEF